MSGKPGKAKALLKKSSAPPRTRSERARTEKKWRASEERYRVTIDSLEDGLHVVDDKLRIVLLNKALERWCDRIGVPRGRAGQFLFDLFPFLSKKVRAEYRGVFRTGRALVTQEMTTIDGEAIATETRKIPVLESGKVRRVITVMRDITRRREMETRLRKSAQLYREIYNATSEAIAVEDTLTGRFVEVNDPMVRMYGYSSKQELLARSIGDLSEAVHPHTQEDALRLHELVMAGAPQVFEWKARRKNGELFPVEVSLRSSSIRGKNRILAVIRDITARKRAEEAWQESEARYAALFRGAAEGILVADATTQKFIYANPAMCRLLGYSEAELKRLKVYDIHPPELRQRVQDEIRAIVRERKCVVPEIPCLRKDGSIVIADINASIMPLNGRDCMVGFFTDVTERKRGEALIRQSEDALREAQRVAHVGSWRWFIQSGQVEWSDEMYRIFGISKEAFSGSLSEVVARGIHPEDRARVEASNRRVIQEKQPVPLEYRVVRPDGTVRVVWAEGGELALDSAGAPAVLTGIVLDITERKRAEQALREGEASYRGLFNSVKEAIYVQDRAGRFLDVNQGAVEMYGHPKDFFIGKTPDIVSAPGRNDMAAVRRAVQKAFDGEPQRLEFWGLRSNGEVFPKEVHLTQGTYFGQEVTIALARDITERRKVEAALQEAHDSLEEKVRERTARLRALAAQLVRAEEQERQRIARILHEDLQQMMTGARLMLNDLRKQHPGKGAKQAVDRISHILDKGVQLTRSLTLDLRPPMLHEAGLAMALKWLAGDMKEKFGLTLQVRAGAAVEPESKEVRVFIFEAVRELLFNVAKHAGAKRAQVALSHAAGNLIQVEVKDRGRGFDAVPGRAGGFGLFSLRERAESFGGEMQIRSAPGKGTCVTLTVPGS